MLDQLSNNTIMALYSGNNALYLTFFSTKHWKNPLLQKINCQEHQLHATNVFQGNKLIDTTIAQ